MHPEIPPVSAILKPDYVSIINPRDKNEALSLTAELLKGHEAIKDFTAFRNSIFQRESVVSTGIGLGVAVPHVKIPEVSDYVLAVARSTIPIDFDSLDGQPVRLLFMIGASDRAAVTYVRFLAQVVGLVKDDDRRNALIHAEDAREIYRILVPGAQ